jgi:NADH dehydrogenase
MAWWVWLFKHILYLARFGGRLRVLWVWAVAYLSFGRGARVITGEGTPPRAAVVEPEYELEDTQVRIAR